MPTVLDLVEQPTLNKVNDRMYVAVRETPRFVHSRPRPPERKLTSECPVWARVGKGNVVNARVRSEAKPEA